MHRLRSPLAIIFCTVFIHLVGFGIVIPVLPLYAQHFGASPWMIGLLLASYSIMQMVCAPLLGRVSDRIGRRPVLLVCMAGTAVGFLVMGLATTVWVLFLARIIDGITGGNISTAQAYIADVTSPAERSRGMGIIGAGFGLGFICGPAIGGVLSHISMAAPLLFAAALAVVNMVAIYLWLPESLTPHARPVAAVSGADARLPRRRIVRLIMAIYLLETIAFALLTATYPLFTHAVFAYGAAENGYIFAGVGVINAIIQGVLLGWLVRAFREDRLVIAGAAIAATGLCLLPLAHTATGLWVTTAGVAIGHGLMVATLNGIASHQTVAAQQGRVLGLMQSTASLGRIIGPVLGGGLLHLDISRAALHIGRTPYWAGGALLLLACSLSVCLSLQRSSVS